MQPVDGRLFPLLPAELFDELAGGIFVTDAPGAVLAVNRTAADMLGYAEAELVGKNIAAFTHPDDFAQRGSPGALSPGQTLRGRRRLLHKDGRYRMTEGRGRVLDDGRIVSVVRDVTAPAALESALSESAEQLRFMANALPALIAYVGTDVRYAWANESYHRWFGLTPEQVRGRHVSEVLGAAAWEQLRTYVERALAGEEVAFDHRVVYKTGPARDVRAAYVPHRDAGGQVRGFAALVHDITELKAAEVALRRSEHMLEQSQSTAHVGSWEVSFADDGGGAAGSGSLRWSDESYRIFGYQPGAVEASQALFIACVHADDREAVRAASRAGFERGEPFEKEYRIVRPDGTERLVHAWTQFERDAGGRPLRMLGTAQDITERKQAEQEVRQAREELQLVMDSTAAIITRCDCERRIVWTNESNAARLGKRPEQIVGRPLREIEGESAYLALEPAIERVLAGETVELETEVPDHALGPRWMHVVCSPTLDAAGRPDGWVSVLTDNTHRRELERALRLSEVRYRSLVGAITSVVWSADAEGRFVEPQAAWEAYTGQAWERHAGRGWNAAVHPDDRARIDATWSEAVRTGASHRSACRVWHAPTAGYRHCESSAVAMRNLDGSIREWIGTLVDEHERERALEELREADRRKDEFLAMLSHELRNPLAPLLNAVEVLERVGRDQHEIAARYRAVIARQVQHMKRLLDDLLDLSRVSQGKIQLRKQPVELGALLLQAIEISRPMIVDKRQQLSVTLAHGPLPLEADPTRIVQVLANLLNNAAKYTDTGGNIALRLSAEDGEAVIKVRDDGMGMSPELLGRAFDLFVQEPRSLDRAQGGLGIGLTMVRTLVKMHGGSVRAFSEGAGRGTEIVVRLPLAAGAAAVAASAAAAPAGTAAGAAAVQAPVSLDAAVRPLRVLVVDDNVDAARALEYLLAGMGHQVTLAHHGPGALAAAAAVPPELVFLDIGLPGMDGYEVAARLRAAGHGSAVLVALTGYGREEDMRRSTSAGFDHHLVKPVDFAAVQKIAADPRGKG